VPRLKKEGEGKDSGEKKGGRRKREPPPDCPLYNGVLIFSPHPWKGEGRGEKERQSKEERRKREEEEGRLAAVRRRRYGLRSYCLSRKDCIALKRGGKGEKNPRKKDNGKRREI